MFPLLRLQGYLAGTFLPSTKAPVHLMQRSIGTNPMDHTRQGNLCLITISFICFPFLAFQQNFKTLSDTWLARTSPSKSPCNEHKWDHLRCAFGKGQPKSMGENPCWITIRSAKSAQWELNMFKWGNKVYIFMSACCIESMEWVLPKRLPPSRGTDVLQWANTTSWHVILFEELSRVRVPSSPNFQTFTKALVNIPSIMCHDHPNWCRILYITVWLIWLHAGHGGGPFKSCELWRWNRCPHTRSNHLHHKTETRVWFQIDTWYA